MSFTSSLKRAFGFQSAIDDEDDEFDTTLPTYAVGERHAEDRPIDSVRPARIVNPFATVDTSSLPANIHASEPAMTDNSLPGDLFDALISLFNSIQPDFVAKCLSTEEQRRYIYRSLDEGIKRRLEASLSARQQTEALSTRAADLQSRVDSLQAELDKARSEAESLANKLKLANDERNSLSKTIETNLYNQAHSESKLRKEIKRLEKALEEKPKSKGRKRKISAIDETNESTDWFDSTPPPGMGKVEMPDNPDFGYQAPQRKKQNDNDAQMLLW